MPEFDEEIEKLLLDLKNNKDNDELANRALNYILDLQNDIQKNIAKQINLSDSAVKPPALAVGI